MGLGFRVGKGPFGENMGDDWRRCELQTLDHPSEAEQFSCKHMNVYKD